MKDFELREVAAVLAAMQKVSTDGEQFMVVPDGFRLESIQGFQPRPSRIMGHFATTDPKSWGKYVEKFKGPEMVVFAQKDKAIAVFDFHTKDSPAWGDHIAIYKGEPQDLAPHLTDVTVLHGQFDGITL